MRPTAAASMPPPCGLGGRPWSLVGLASLAILVWMGMLSDSPAAPINRQKLRVFQSAAQFMSRADRIVGYRESVDSAGQAVVQRQLQCQPLPWNELTVVAVSPDGETWIGTTRGAVRLRQPCGPLEYFAGKRWLPDDRVLGIGFEPSGNAVWIRTTAGYSRIEYRPMTLAEKAELFEQRVQSRHLRHGLTASSVLATSGDLESSRPVSTDNDGLWTAIYLAAESFRYAATGATDAREHARTAAAALLRLEAITGIPGFPARSLIEIGREPEPVDGEWHTTAEGKYRWKGDTSSDEIVGHYFGLSVYSELAASPSEQQEVAALVDRITLHILDHGFALVDRDGQPTRWGWWGPERIWDDPDETGLRALEILSHLRVAIALTQDLVHRARFEEAYRNLIEHHRYHLLTRNQKINYPGRVNHSDDELAFLSYYPLLRYEADPELREIYRTSLERSWQAERAERNPLWNFIYAVGIQTTEYDREASMRTLREIPMDRIDWTVQNSHRLDVLANPLRDRMGREQSLNVLPYDELPVLKWNGNPFLLDGGREGLAEDEGTCFLLPYWLGRYHRLISD